MRKDFDNIKFVKLVKPKFSTKELNWITSKIAIISKLENSKKFAVFYSLASRFIGNESPSFTAEDIKELQTIYPGFNPVQWSKLDISRVLLMLALDVSINKEILFSFFEIAEMNEQISLYKGLFLLPNAIEFKHQFTDGIRTNMVNVFDSIAAGNPFAKTYLNENAWNQLILKSLFLDRKLYVIEGIDAGKNINLANMLQDYVKERWAAGRDVSLEIWRMIEGFLRKDIKELINKRPLKGKEKEILNKLLDQNSVLNKNYWDAIGAIT